MTPLDVWRATQHDHTTLPADITETIWLHTTAPSEVQTERYALLQRLRLEQAVRMSPAEIALMHRRPA